MDYFVEENSVVREIWGKSDTILFIFSGAAAEFALNKAVDWLYFTGRLPADPLARLFSTVTYAREIIFSEKEKAHKAIDKITAIHAGVEANRSAKIPDWAYRDVLFMLIYYSIASFELLKRKLTDAEKEEVFKVFYTFGVRMNLKDLPQNYNEWLIAHDEHITKDLEKSHYTADLFKQYKKHLGNTRYKILLEGQKLVVPNWVNDLLFYGCKSILKPLVFAYKILYKCKLDWIIKSIILPPEYKSEINALDTAPR